MAAATVRRKGGVAIVRVPTAARAKKIARRVGGAAVRAARDERHRGAALVAAGVLGYVSRPGGPELPHVRQLGLAGTYGLAAWAASKAGFGGQYVSHAATGLLCVALYEYVREQPAATSGAYEDDID